MGDSTFNIDFEAEGKIYKGRVIPSEKTHDDLPVSYHVVLNEVFFGVVSNNGNWTVNEQRPKELTAAVGKAIEAYIQTSRSL
jgi:hypothetical protein